MLCQNCGFEMFVDNPYSAEGMHCPKCGAGYPTWGDYLEFTGEPLEK